MVPSMITNEIAIEINTRPIQRLRVLVIVFVPNSLMGNLV